MYARRFSIASLESLLASRLQGFAPSRGRSASSAPSVGRVTCESDKVCLVLHRRSSSSRHVASFSFPPSSSGGSQCGLIHGFVLTDFL